MYRMLNVFVLAVCLASSLPASAEPDVSADVERGQSTAAERSRGRTQLALGQAVHGLFVGAEVWWLLFDDPLEESSLGVATAAGLGGAATGVAAALLLTPNGIEPGHAALLNTGPLWGGFVGFTASRAHYGIGPRGRVGMAVLGQAAGLGLGHLAWELFEPSYVQTWIIDSTALWTTMLLTSGLIAVRPDEFPPRRPILAGLHVWGVTAGLVGGGFLAAAAPDMRGGRLAALHLGGVLGGFAGLFALGLAVPSGRGGSLAAGFTLGAPAGIVVAALLTRDKPRKQDTTAALSLGMTEFDDGTRGLSIGGVF